MNLEHSEKVFEFIKEFTSILKIEKIRISDLYQSYLNWCRRNGERPIDKQLFCETLEEFGFKPIRLGHNGDGGFDLSMLTEGISADS